MTTPRTLATAIAATLAASIALTAHADILQSWRAVVIPNPTDPVAAADPAFAPPSTGTTLDVHPGESILFIWSVFLTDTTIPAAANALQGSVLRGIGAATSQIVGTSNANGKWSPGTIPGAAGVYNSTGTQGSTLSASATVQTPNSIIGCAVIGNGLRFLAGSGAPNTAIDNTEGVDVYGIIWTPNNYIARTTSFVGSAFTTGAANNNVLWYRNGTSDANGFPFAVPATGSTAFSINIVPAPASLSLFALAALATRRRRG